MTRTIRHLLCASILALSLVAVLSASSDAKKRECSTITKCRESITWNHSVIASLSTRLAIADGVAPGGRAVPLCHRLSSCQRLQREQEHSRIWAEGAWQRLIHDNSIVGAERIVRYRFTTCGGPAKAAEAAQIVGWESGWQRFNVNAAGDTSWWQIERPAHPEVSLEQAEDAWVSTGIAERWSACGQNWDPTWSSVRDHGRDWD